MHIGNEQYTPIPRRRISNLLLVGNPYDGFLLEDAGFVAGEPDPDSEAPTFELVRSGKKALRRLEEGGFDMVLVDLMLPDMPGAELAAKVRRLYPGLPAVVMTSNTDMGGSSATTDGEQIPDLFIWYGAPDLLHSMIKLKEDELNTPVLTREQHSLVILLVEDEPNFYSHFVPVLYERIRESSIELLPRSQRPKSHWEIIDSRPLVLLRRNFEDACEVLYQYQMQVMVLITDMRFPVNGVLKGDAGLRLLYRARSINGHLPVAVHSREKINRKAVQEAQARFLWKDSSSLLTDLDHFLMHFCGFGPFVFRWPAGDRYGVARTLRELHKLVMEVPDVVFEFHALHFDFSTWLAVHGYLELAHQVRELRIRAAEPRQDVIRLLEAELKK
jgi:CheY-like chemotaxis protein